MKMLTILEASRAYRVSRASIYRAIERGQMTDNDGKVNPAEIGQLIRLGVLTKIRPDK